ncbi:MAG: NAD-dependent epimerase/dehydratase family protein [Limisphaerales bacterium]
MKRVLVTGHNGYLGSVMAPHLAAAGYDVFGFDTGFFSDCNFTPDPEKFPTVKKDLRDLTPKDLEGFDAVVHLAALSNDPIGNLNDGWTEEINYQASVKLAELARAAGVERFLFSSSCIMYGAANTLEVNENSPLDPKTEYARSKVKAEKALMALADKNFSPVYIRNGTVYGVSPRMRFDTVLNDLVGSATTTGKVVVHSDGKPWRPVMHVQDVARYFQAFLEAPRDKIHNQAFNAGANSLNHQIIELARIAVQTVPGCKLEMVPKPGADQRTYKANFDKFAGTFPDFKFKWNATSGAAELYGAFKKVNLQHSDYTDKKFTRLKWLHHLLDSGCLDGSLRWKTH